MSRLTHVAVLVRRTLVRRPWIYWLVVLAACVAAAAVVADELAQVDAARAEWGEAQPVWVAVSDAEPGEPVAVSVEQVPIAVVPAAALDPERDELPVLARQRVAAGEIVTIFDVAPGDRSTPLALVPDGWLVVPIVEATASGASIGDRVQVASGGMVVAGEALVVGSREQVTLLATPSDVAAMIPAAADADGVTLLRLP